MLIPLLIFQLMNSSREAQQELTYSEFRAQVEGGNVVRVTVKEGRELEGELRSTIEKDWLQIESFHTLLPYEADKSLIDELEEAGVQTSGKGPGSNWVAVLVGVLPWLLIIGLWVFLFRQMQSGGSRAFSFGKSKAKLLTGDTPKVTFADVAGCDEAKEELQEIIEFLKDPAKFGRLGGRLPKGALLIGPPGTGKTLMARAVAGEAACPFFSMSGSDFVEMFVGVGASRVRDLFEQGKAHAPCIVFIDEIDAVGRHRGAGLGGGHDEREQTLNQLLVEMDGSSRTKASFCSPRRTGPTCWIPRCSVRGGLTGRSWWIAPMCGVGRESSGYTRGTSRSRTTWTSSSSRRARPASRARTSRTS